MSTKNQAKKGKKPTKLEKALSDYRNIGRRKGRYLALLQDLVAKCMDMTQAEMACIDFLLEKDFATAGELAKISGLTSGAITGVITRLEKKGYVTYARDSKDRRKVIVRGIPKKMAIYIYCWHPIAENVFKVLSTYSLNQLELINDYNKKLTDVYEKGMEDMAKDRDRKFSQKSAWLD